jgi:hypothetical protein
VKGGAVRVEVGDGQGLPSRRTRRGMATAKSGVAGAGVGDGVGIACRRPRKGRTTAKGGAAGVGDGLGLPSRRARERVATAEHGEAGVEAGGPELPSRRSGNGRSRRRLVGWTAAAAKRRVRRTWCGGKLKTGVPVGCHFIAGNWVPGSQQLFLGQVNSFSVLCFFLD